MHVLRMYWDGEATPSVEVPVGDFFGVGFGFTEKCSSAMMAIDDRRGPTNTDPSASGAARNCYFPMPFAKGAKITVTNEGKQPSMHWFEVNCKIFKKPPANVGLLPRPVPPGHSSAGRPVPDARRQGARTLVGCVLSVKNNDGGWWGEGDEIVEIDGRRAIQGTGSEDYFCESYGLREGCFPYFGVTVIDEHYSTRLSLARARSGALPEVAPLPHRAGQRRAALPQRQLLLQRRLLVSDRAPRTVSAAAQRQGANWLGGREKEVNVAFRSEAVNLLITRWRDRNP